MTDKSTKQAVRKFEAILPKLSEIRGVKYDTIQQVSLFNIEDRFTLNCFMEEGVPLLTRSN